MSTITNLYGVEFRNAVGGGVIVIYNGRRIAKIKDDTLMTEVKEVRRNAEVFDTLGCNRAMFVVEDENHLYDLLAWDGLGRFVKINITCFCYIHPGKLRDALPQAVLTNTTELDISAVNGTDSEMWQETHELLVNIESLRLLGCSFER